MIKSVTKSSHWFYKNFKLSKKITHFTWQCRYFWRKPKHESFRFLFSSLFLWFFQSILSSLIFLFYIILIIRFFDHFRHFWVFSLPRNLLTPFFEINFSFFPFLLFTLWYPVFFVFCLISNFKICPYFFFFLS